MFFNLSLGAVLQAQNWGDNLRIKLKVCVAVKPFLKPCKLYIMFFVIYYKKKLEK